MQVLEDEDERALVGDRLEDRRHAANASSRRSPAPLVAFEARERLKLALDPGGVRVRRERTAPRPDAACRPPVRRCRARGSGLRLDDLAERPDVMPSPYGSERPCRRRRDRSAGLDAEELEHEPALADSGDADERDSCGLRSRTTRASVSRRSVELLLAANERRAAHALDSRHASARGRATPNGDRNSLPLRLDLRSRLGSSIARSVALKVVSSTRIAVRSAPPLEARGGVDHVAGSHAFAGVGPCAERHQRFARRDPDPDLQLALLFERFTDHKRRANRALRVVLVRDRRPKTAMTASPMNFSTVPPKRSSSRAYRAWYGWSRRRTSSGSIRSALAVKPTRSQKRHVTTCAPRAPPRVRVMSRTTSRSARRPRSRARSSADFTRGG